MWKQIVCFVACVGMCVVLGSGAACDPAPGPKDGGTDAGIQDQAPPKLEPTLASIEARVFQPSCSLPACHGGGAGGLTLGEGKSHGNLVGVDSNLASGEKLVVAGDPEKSVLLIVLEKQLGSIRQMPPEVSLSKEKIEAVREWIKQGAKAN